MVGWRRTIPGPVEALLLALLVSPVAADPAADTGVTPVAETTPTEAAATARVTYVTPSSVYVDAGSAEGLRTGHRLEVVRDGRVVAVGAATAISRFRTINMANANTKPLARASSKRIFFMIFLPKVSSCQRRPV